MEDVLFHGPEQRRWHSPPAPMIHLHPGRGAAAATVGPPIGRMPQEPADRFRAHLAARR
ncbi:hypothetical protein [Lentzea sp. NEAU-D7]|uniref:hypothetical protein n=1 Tax=Lentzea sp. NEAU-D7 TaxID=2994667 RepID=UPI00224B76E2|nr:hypothetical protein [Lentzea sp. NEAU-D7]MCX2951396.1 hypothetical protein [Lentzea sp. NEAU-D7]